MTTAESVQSVTIDICEALGLDPKRPPINITPEQAAKVIGCSKNTLNLWRSTGRYDLPFTKVGRFVRYPIKSVAEFLVSRTITETR